MTQLMENYLDLMENTLTGMIYLDQAMDPWSRGFDARKRLNGLDWPSQAHTMIGFYRLRNIRQTMLHVIEHDVPGDVIETGVWRGGATIYMRAILKALGITDRKVWVADSFAGLPQPEDRCPADTNDPHHMYKQLVVPLEVVQDNFRRYGMLDGQVEFLKGWFKDTLPAAPIERLAILRLDGDMYSSTMDAISALYDKVSAGGFIIVDDYGVIPACRRAIDDFRHSRGIVDAIQNIDNVGHYWQKESCHARSLSR